LYFTDDIGIVFGPPMDYPLRFSREKRHYGMVGLAQLFDSHRERWSFVLPSWLTYIMLPVGTLQGYFILIQISVAPSDMGDACSLLSFRRSDVSPCSHETYGYV
jgi:hypothetical protein